MLHREPEYRRRIGEQAKENQRQAEREWDEAAKNTNQNKIVRALERINEEINSHGHKTTPEKKREWPWKLGEILGLWLAAAVGAIAVIYGTTDADKQRKVMQDTLKEMRDEQRPWVSFAIIPTLQTGVPFKVAVQWGNVGHSPAFRIRTQASLTVTSKGDVPPAPLADFLLATVDVIKSSGILLPGQVTSQTVIPNKAPVTDIDMSKVHDGVIGIWIRGRTEYVDQYGGAHYTMFRAVYSVDASSFLYTEEGNDAH